MLGELTVCASSILTSSSSFLLYLSFDSFSFLLSSLTDVSLLHLFQIGQFLQPHLQESLTRIRNQPQINGYTSKSLLILQIHQTFRFMLFKLNLLLGKVKILYLQIQDLEMKIWFSLGNVEVSMCFLQMKMARRRMRNGVLES